MVRVVVYYKNGSLSSIPLNTLSEAYEYVNHKINYRSVDIVYIEDDMKRKVHDRFWGAISNQKAKEMPE